MGTAAEWIRVLEIGGLFGVLTLMWDAVTRRESFASLINILATALASFVFGMLWVFEWRIFHGRIAVTFVAVVVGMLAAGEANRRARKLKEAHDVETDSEQKGSLRIPKYLR